jgi:tripartite-type tricarboxylate transporter receptor subunit TctC
MVSLLKPTDGACRLLRDNGPVEKLQGRFMTRKLCALILLGALLAGGSQAQAQTYPNRTVTIVVTSAAGALTDVLTRAVAQRLSQKWGQTVVVENRGGAGHTIAATAVLKSDLDGHTLLASETGFSTIQPYLHAKGKLPYDPDKDFVPVAGYATIPVAMLVHPSLPAKSVADVIALAKQKPGALNYGTAGVGTALHTSAMLLESLAGIKLTAVHYRGAAPALNDVLAGHINLVIMGPSVALPSVRAGKLNMLGFGSQKRVAEFPNVPTIAETVPGYDAGVTFGLYAPSAAPHAVVQKVNADVQQIIGDPEFHKRYLEPMVVQPVPGSLNGFADYLRKDAAKWAKVIEAANLKVD